MKNPNLQKSRKSSAWPRKISVGRMSVSVYRRCTPLGNYAYMVANYADGKRRFDSYAEEADALKAAGTLARQLNERDVMTASMTREQAIEYASAVQTLQPLNLALVSAVTTLAEAVKLVGDLSSVVAAAKFYATRSKRTVPKRVADLVAEFLSIKEGRKASERYLQDLRYRLNRFATDCQKDACNVTTADIQAWLDGQKLGPQAYTNFRRVLNVFFEFAAARSYAADNPVERVERVKVRAGEHPFFTPTELHRLLAAASADYLPSLAIAAFAGLRSSEIERLEWSDIHLSERYIVVGAGRAKNAGRRIIPIHDNLAAWLAPYAFRQGKVWAGTHKAFYQAQQATAAATEVKTDQLRDIAAQPSIEWKANALRHSYASYRFAQTGDAGRVAGELGNTPAVVHKHYRELVKPKDAEKWFGLFPEGIANLLPDQATAQE